MSSGENAVDVRMTGRKTVDGSMTTLPLSSIVVIKGFNPRQSEGDTDTLRDSIAKRGLINPITVRATSKKDKYQLVSGHRRMKALRELKRDDVAVIIRTDLDDDIKALAYAVAENSEDGRTNLTYIEMGSAFMDMMKEGYKIDRIVSESGVAKHTVRRSLKLMELDDSVIKLVQDGLLSPSAAVFYASLEPSVQAQIDLTGMDDPSRSLIRALAAKATKELAKASGADKETKSGKQKGKVGVAWRSPTERTAAIQELAHTAFNTKNPGASAAREQLQVLYWVRGESKRIGELSSSELTKLIKVDNTKYLEKMKADAKKAEKAPAKKKPAAKGSKAKAKAKKKGKK